MLTSYDLKESKFRDGFWSREATLISVLLFPHCRGESSKNASKKKICFSVLRLWEEEEEEGRAIVLSISPGLSPSIVRCVPACILNLLGDGFNWKAHSHRSICLAGPQKCSIQFLLLLLFNNYFLLVENWHVGLETKFSRWIIWFYSLTSNQITIYCFL